MCPSSVGVEMLTVFTRLRKCAVLPKVIPNARMSWESKRDHEAIMTYNKLLKQTPRETSYTESELRMAKKFFEQIKEYRRRSQEGFEPSKLFMVWRHADVVGRPYWEKDVLIELGLAKSKTDYAIVKNTPSMNQKLWSIKHLIRIRPITFPFGFPDENDESGTFLKQTGELVVSPRLKVDESLLEANEEKKQKTLDHRTITEDLRIKWDKAYPKMF